MKRKRESKIQILSKKLTTCHIVESKMSKTAKSEKVCRIEIEKQRFFSKDNTPKERMGDKSKPPICKNEKRLKNVRYGSQASHKNCPNGFINNIGDQERKIRIMHTQMYTLITLPKI